MTFDITCDVRNRLVRAYALWLAQSNTCTPTDAIKVAAEYEQYINNGEEKQVKTVDHDNGRLV